MRSELALPHRDLAALAELVADIGEPCWVSGATAAIRDGGTSEAFLHRRIIALRASGREGPRKLLAV